MGVQDLVQVNLLKGVKESLGAKTFLGRVAIPLAPFCTIPGEETQVWYDLGRGEWGNEEGTVRPFAAHICLRCFSVCVAMGEGGALRVGFEEHNGTDCGEIFASA